MKRVALALALAWSLAGCISLGGMKMPALGKAAPAAPAAAPALHLPDCPPGARAEIPTRPVLPAGASFPAPVTDAEKAGFALYSEFLGQLGDYGRVLKRRALEAKTFCDTPK